MGFGVSFQNVGINRCGKYREVCRTKNPTPGRSPFHGEGRTAALKVNEPWRRISDLVGANAETRDPKIRKRCVRKLVSWIDRKVSAERLQIENCKFQNANLTEAWGEDAFEWRRVVTSGLSVEGICFRLGISRGRLTSLLKEVMGISAGELLDGFKIRGLRRILVGQLREAASRIWGMPGDFAVRRVGIGQTNDPPLSPLMKGGKTAGALRAVAGGTAAPHKRRSRYFRTSASEFLGRESWEEEGLRVSELLGALDSLREENDWRIQAFAVRLGFESAGKFRAACLTVMGRTLEQLERVLAHEIVHYYLAAEDLALRKLAGREDEMGIRAREVYWGSEDVPTEPFLDRWSAAEFAKPEWIAKMREQFG